MTKIWGPLGWATLHSVAALYPDSPSELEKALLVRWISAFAKTIVCEKCQGHFEAFLRSYTQPWSTSRREFSLFVLRAHNSVNARNGQKILTVSEAFAALRIHVAEDKAALQRQSYILYIRNDWSRNTTLGGITAARYIQEMVATETSYWSTRTYTWDDVEALLTDDSILPPTKPAPKRSAPIVRMPTNTVTYTHRNVTSGTPRFSFLSW
jgi:hypothetical protein